MSVFALAVAFNAIAIVLIYAFGAGYFAGIHAASPWNLVIAAGLLVGMLALDAELAFGLYRETSVQKH